MDFPLCFPLCLQCGIIVLDPKQSHKTLSVLGKDQCLTNR